MSGETTQDIGLSVDDSVKSGTAVTPGGELAASRTNGTTAPDPKRYGALTPLIAWLVTNNLEILCGMTVSLAQVPEAVAFSFVAGVKPSVGLTAAWIVGTVTAVAGGRPAMICGATGALAVVVGDLVCKHGVEGCRDARLECVCVVTYQLMSAIPLRSTYSTR